MPWTIRPSRCREWSVLDSLASAHGIGQTSQRSIQFENLKARAASSAARDGPAVVPESLIVESGVSRSATPGRIDENAKVKTDIG